MIVVIVLAVYAAAVFLDFLPTVKTKKPKLIWPCLFILCVGAAVQILYELKVNVPSPAEPITKLVSSFFNIK